MSSSLLTTKLLLNIYSMSLVTAAIILLIICVIASARANARYNEYISGYWVIHPDFASQAALNEFQLFIGPRAGGSTQAGGSERDGYLIIVDSAGTVVANGAVDIDVRFSMGSALGAMLQNRNDECRGRLKLIAASGMDTLPTDLDLSLSILNGTLTLYDAGRVYACLVKDIAVSDTALQAYSASDPNSASAPVPAIKE